MKYNVIDHIIIFSFVVLFLVGCANQEPPQGGPIDRTTPEIVSTYPDSSSIAKFQ